MLGTRRPGAEAGGGGLLEVPAPRLVDVPGQEAPAIGEPEGLEVLGGGGRGGVLAVAAAGGQRSCDGAAPKLAPHPPPPTTAGAPTLPLRCAGRAGRGQQSWTRSRCQCGGRGGDGNTAGLGDSGERGLSPGNDPPPPQPSGRPWGPPTVGHRVARGVEVHEVGAPPGARLRRGGDGAQPGGRRARRQGPQLSPGTDKRTGRRHGRAVPEGLGGRGGCGTSPRKRTLGWERCLLVTGTARRGDLSCGGTVTPAWGRQPSWDPPQRARGSRMLHLRRGPLPPRVWGATSPGSPGEGFQRDR